MVIIICEHSFPMSPFLYVQPPFLIWFCSAWNFDPKIRPKTQITRYHKQVQVVARSLNTSWVPTPQHLAPKVPNTSVCETRRRPKRIAAFVQRFIIRTSRCYLTRICFLHVKPKSLKIYMTKCRSWSHDWSSYIFVVSRVVVPYWIPGYPPKVYQPWVNWRRKCDSCSALMSFTLPKSSRSNENHGILPPNHNPRWSHHRLWKVTQLG